MKQISLYPLDRYNDGMTGWHDPLSHGRENRQGQHRAVCSIWNNMGTYLVPLLHYALMLSGNSLYTMILSFISYKGYEILRTSELSWENPIILREECGSEDPVRHGRVDLHEAMWRSKCATINLQDVHFLKQVVWVDVFLHFLRLHILHLLQPCSTQRLSRTKVKRSKS